MKEAKLAVAKAIDEHRLCLFDGGKLVSTQQSYDQKDGKSLGVKVRVDAFHSE